MKKVFNGFDYTVGQSLRLTGKEWRTRFESVVASGGSRRLIGDRGDVKDPTAFDAEGRMLFELYQQTECRATK